MQQIEHDGADPFAVLHRQAKPALQLGNACLLRQQECDEFVLRELVERGAVHRLLGIGPPKSCQPNLSHPVPAPRHSHNIRAPHPRRLIGPFNLAEDLTCCQKWLKAGILEDEVVTISERGTRQGSVISPLLANIHLHYAFDLWANR